MCGCLVVFMLDTEGVFLWVSMEEILFLGAQSTILVDQFNDKWKNNDVNYFTNLKKKNLFLFNPLKTKRRPLYLKPQSVPRCKHFSSRL